MDVLAHSTITLTATTYAYLTDATRRVAAGMMDDLLRVHALWLAVACGFGMVMPKHG